MRASLVLCALSASADPTKYHNLGYLGQSYDLVKGNPRPQEGIALDPGWHNMQNVMAVCPPNEPDCPAPWNVKIDPGSSCSYEKNLDQVGSAYEYKSSLDKDVTTSGHTSFLGLGKAAFSASADFNTAKDETGSDFKFYSSVSAVCSIYRAYFQVLPQNASWLTATFRFAVSTLPTVVDNSTMPSFITFANHFGTHYAEGVAMGGKALYTKSFGKADYSSLSSSGVDLKAAASVSFGVKWGAEGDAEAKARSSDYNAFSSMHSDEHISCAGGTGLCPNMQDPLSLAFSESWIAGVTANPVPISYTLESLDVLLTSVYFPDDADIIAKQKALYDFYNNSYCGNVAACDPPLPVQYWLGAAPMSTPRSVLAVGVLGTKLYAVGGFDKDGTLASVEAYDPGSNQWSAVAPMSTPRGYLAVGVLGAKLYAVGGNDGNNHLASVERLTADDQGSPPPSALAPMDR